MLKRLSIIGTVIALVALTAVSPAAAAKKGTDRPFKAELAGQVTFDLFGPEALDLCGDYLGVLTRTETHGRATHAGKVEASWWHCPVEPDGHDNGHLTITAANRDQIIVEYVDDGSDPWSFPLQIVDGTGRFAGATGELTLHYGLEPALVLGPDGQPIIGPDGEPVPDFFSPWGWWGSIEGSISY